VGQGLILLTVGSITARNPSLGAGLDQLLTLFECVVVFDAPHHPHPQGQGLVVGAPAVVVGRFATTRRILRRPDHFLGRIRSDTVSHRAYVL
jgi:hypothetical protein